MYPQTMEAFRLDRTHDQKRQVTLLKETPPASGREAQREALRLARVEREVVAWVELIGPRCAAMILRGRLDLF